MTKKAQFANLTSFLGLTNQQNFLGLGKDPFGIQTKAIWCVWNEVKPSIIYLPPPTQKTMSERNQSITSLTTSQRMEELKWSLKPRRPTQQNPPSPLLSPALLLPPPQLAPLLHPPLPPYKIHQHLIDRPRPLYWCWTTPTTIVGQFSTEQVCDKCPFGIKAYTLFVLKHLSRNNLHLVKPENGYHMTFHIQCK